MVQVLWADAPDLSFSFLLSLVRRTVIQKISMPSCAWPDFSRPHIRSPLIYLLDTEAELIGVYQGN